MKKIIFSSFAILSLISAGIAVTHLSGNQIAHAQQTSQSSKDIIEAAKDRGEVGEKFNGQLAAVKPLSAQVEAAMDDINIRRKTLYTRLAEQKNESLLDVGKVAAAKQFRDAEPGHFLLGEDGVWRKK